MSRAIPSGRATGPADLSPASGSSQSSVPIALTDREKEVLIEGRLHGHKGPLAANLVKKGIARKIAGCIRYELTQFGVSIQAVLREQPQPLENICPVRVSEELQLLRRNGVHINEISHLTGITLRTLQAYLNREGPIARKHERVLADYLGLPPPLEALEERRRIVEWLRDNSTPEIARTGYLAFRVLADAIERGDYEPGRRP